jgi:hypothetical protein
MRSFFSGAPRVNSSKVRFYKTLGVSESRFASACAEAVWGFASGLLGSFVDFFTGRDAFSDWTRASSALTNSYTVCSYWAIMREVRSSSVTRSILEVPLSKFFCGAAMSSSTFFLRSLYYKNLIS